MSSSKWKGFFKATPVRAILVLALVLGGWNLYLFAAGPSKISSEVAAVAAETPGDGQRVMVELRFQPERFHTLKLQDYGHVMRVEGDNVYLRSVSLGGIDAISRVFWVSQILPQE